MFKIGARVRLHDQEEVGTIIVFGNGGKALVNFGPRWVNATPVYHPDFRGCAYVLDRHAIKEGDPVQVVGVPGGYLVQGVREWEGGGGTDILVDTGETWYDPDELELAE